MATTELAITQSVSEFDNATDTAFLGKTDRDTFVFTGVASNVRSTVLTIDSMIYLLNHFICEY